MTRASDSIGYDAVIATRNRPEALALTIPRLLAQSVPPAALIVVDSSDDPAPVAAAVKHAVGDWPGRLVVEHARPGLPHQRNRGLAHVTAPVVFFPDDDSILLPGAAEEIMAVYARDAEGRIAAVCAAEAHTPPGDIAAAGYDMTGSHRREARLRGLRNSLEKRITALKPAHFLGRQLNARHDPPDWLAELDVVPVEYMTGFRMTFRTAAIRASGFDEALGGYALDEDIDASFSAMRHGLVVGARRARIYHHRFPSGRGDGARLGRMEILNRVYVGRKHAAQDGLPEGTKARVGRLLRSFVLLKFLAALAGAGSPFGRARIAGAWSALRAAGPLWRAAPDTLAETYAAAFARATRP